MGHRIHGKLYDLRTFKDHPGGRHILDLCQNEPDCTALFESSHAFCNFKPIRKMMKKYVVPGTTCPEMFSFHENGFYFECRRRVLLKVSKKNVKHGRRAWATIQYFLSLFLACQNVMLFGKPSLLKAVFSFFSGICAMSLGFNILHDASHSALSKHVFVNRFASQIIQILLLWNHSLWTYHHVVRHHQNTGDLEYDPDMIHLRPYFRKTNKTEKRKQEFTTQCLSLKLAFAHVGLPGIWLAQALSYYCWIRKKRLWRMDFPPMSSTNYIFLNHSAQAIFIIFELYHARFFFFLHIIGSNVAYFVGSAPNHDMYPKHERIPNWRKTDWGEIQVRMSSNFLTSYPLFCRFLGGLTHQIEHHLFPTLSNHEYSKISTVVQKCCKDYNIEYHCESSLTNVWEKIVKTYLRAMT